MEDKYRSASYSYAKGEPIMTDSEFDQLEKVLIKEGSALVDSVSEDFLDDDIVGEVNYETFSIKAVDTWGEVEDFLRAYPNNTFVATLKMDGICTKLAIDRNKMVGQSRNRNARTALDFTDAVNIVVRKPGTFVPVTVTGEAFVPWEDLPHLRETYDESKYIMPRSAAITLLRRPKEHLERDVKLMKFRAFNTDKNFDDYETSLKWLRNKGFEVPKYRVFRPDLQGDLKAQLSSIFEEVDTGEPSDGIVLQVNERDVKPNITGKYMSTQIAVKLDKWGGDEYEAEVIGLNIGMAKGNKGVTLQIKPYTLTDNSTITKVNAYNLGIVNRNKIKKGSIIRFVRVSNNMCNLVYK